MSDSGGSIIPTMSVLDVSFSLFLLQLVLILSTCRLLSVVGQYIRQPGVVFEIVGGIILGPSGLGKIQAFTDIYFPPHSMKPLNIFANFGLQVYLFLVGMEIDLQVIGQSSSSTVAIALVGMIVPFAFGLGVSYFMYVIYMQSSDVPFITFAVFIGSAMAITALPVLVRVLKSADMYATKVGSIALGAAVLTDVLAWVLLVVAICLATSPGLASAGWILLSIVLYAAFLYALGRPSLAWVVRRVEESMVTPTTNGTTAAAATTAATTAAAAATAANNINSHRPSTSFASSGLDTGTVMNNLLTLSLVLMLLSASLMAQLGVEPIVGSFALGVIMPRGSKIVEHCRVTLDNFVLVLFLPVYFAMSGLRTDVTQVRAYPDILVLAAVCAVATLGKAVGAGGAALCCGLPLRESAAVAVLMNIRGLVELIVLNIGELPTAEVGHMHVTQPYASLASTVRIP
jgi:Kef-type K+ transport system membrane component KefB